MRTFKINRDWNCLGCNIHKKGTVTINPGLTVLVGCNGIGKSTLIRQLAQLLEREKIPVLKYDNLHDGGSKARSGAAFRNDFTFLATSMQSSEGENISMNLGRFASQIGTFQRAHKDAKELWIFLDAIDSGFSVDNIIEMKDLFNLIMENSNGAEIYIIASANEYELARGENCYDVLRCKYVKFKTYERYRNFILKTREEKDKRIYED